MKQTCSCLFLIVMYSVAGVLSISTQTTEDKLVAHQKNIRELVLRLLCNSLDASKSAAAGEQGSTRGDELLLTSADLDQRVSLNGIRCRMRSPLASVDDDDDNDDDEAVDVHMRRQVDPLHSCIEAKCSSWNSGNYLDCIYRHCISSFQLGLRSLFLASKRNARTSATKDHLKMSKEDDKERQSTLREGSVEEDGEESGHVVTATADSSSSSSNGGLESRLRVMRRGFNDIADVCVQHHCGSINSHSMDFFSCVESHCAFR